MNNINYKNFKNVCRLCLSTCDINFNKNSVMLDIFHKLTDVHFDTNTELPQQICLKCYDFINKIHAFSITCKQTHSVLMQCLNGYKNIGINQESDIIGETSEQINIKDEITIELVNDNWEINEEMEIKSEITIEEHKIEFINDDWKTNDVSSKEVTERTNDLLSPLVIKISTENKEDHISIDASVSEISNYHKCDQCEKSFRKASGLLSHKRVHSGEKPYICDHCEKSFTQLNNLITHKRLHSGERPYKCDQCEKSFAGSTTLTNHKRVHSGEKPYKCDQCGKSFTQSGSLKDHKRVHSGMRPYKCDQCEKSLSKSNNLKVHKRVHERPYKCDQCAESFTNSWQLNYHKRERPYKCDLCEKSFTQFETLKSHKRVHSYDVK